MSIPFVFPTNQSRAIHAVNLSALTHAWRISGLLRAIPAEAVKHLLLVVSFTDTKGDCRPTLQQLAHATEVSEVKARRRLNQLLQFRWQGQPLVTATRGGDGSEVYMLVIRDTALPVVSEATDQAVSAYAVTDQTAADRARTDQTVTGQIAPAPHPTPSTEIRYEQSKEQPRERPLTQREKVIEASRRKYGRPRAEVERMIAEQMGWAPPATSTQPATSSATNAAPIQQTTQNRQPAIGDELKRQLFVLGVDQDRVDSLLLRFDRVRIEQQLAWLPYRDARDPAAFLVAAIEHDYEPPLALQREPKHQWEPKHQGRRPQEHRKTGS